MAVYYINKFIKISNVIYAFFNECGLIYNAHNLNKILIKNFLLKVAKIFCFFKFQLIY